MGSSWTFRRRARAGRVAGTPTEERRDVPLPARSGHGPPRGGALHRLRLARAAAVLVLMAGPAVASAPPDRVVLTGGAIVGPGQTAGDVVVVDGTVRILGHVTGDVVAVSGPARVAGRIDGDLIMISDRATLAPTARIGGDLRYGDEKPTIAPGA